MVRYELEPNPNQRVSITQGTHIYEFRLRTFNGMLYADVSVDGVEKAKGVRCVPYGFVIPFPCMEVAGNFVFSSSEKHYPNYKDFGSTCHLYYLTAEEVAVARAISIDG